MKTKFKKIVNAAAPYVTVVAGISVVAVCAYIEVCSNHGYHMTKPASNQPTIGFACVTPLGKRLTWTPKN